MIKRLGVVLFLSISLGISAQQGGRTTPLSLNVLSGVNLPLWQSSTIFGLGGTASFSAEYHFPSQPWLYLGGGLTYDFDPFLDMQRSISVISASLGGGINLYAAHWLIIKGGGSFGFFFGTLNDDFSITSYNPLLSIEAGVHVPIGPFLLGAQVSYRYLFGLYGGLSASLGLSYALPIGPRDEPAGMELHITGLEEVFPVFHKYYDDHPLGSVVLRNPFDQPITDVKVSFIIPQYMDGPKESPSLSTLKAGESAIVHLFALFRPNILEVTEATKVQGEVILEYKLNGEAQRKSVMQTVRVLDRNAMTWQDDRRVAAFVTAKDPAVLSFSKNVASSISRKSSVAINQNLLQAMAVHGALSLYGLSYVVDLKSQYAELSTHKQSVDFLQFPRQTLEYKGGDCDDLSILYAALLESVGIETAFITVPGHIFMAFSLGLTPEDARKAFTYPDELIFKDGKSWVPIEVTERGDFLEAWQMGAKEWRENLQSQRVAFYPVTEAWKIFEPVGLPGTAPTLAFPSLEKIENVLKEEVTRFIDREIGHKVIAIQSRIVQTKNLAKDVNELGVLYARYGLYEQAQKQFEKALEGREYLPTLVNLGNAFYLQGQMEKALNLYERAYRVEQSNSTALLGIARASHKLENYFHARKVFAELKKVDPELAQKFSYLELRGDEASRAADLAGTKEFVLWEQQ